MNNQRVESQRKQTNSSVSPKQAKLRDGDFAARQVPSQAPPPRTRETIEDLVPQQQLPKPSSLTPPFYSNAGLYDDSDGSDGSIVFSQQTPTGQYEISKRLAGQPQAAGRHDRFPSFDSVQSTGSFRVLPNSSSPAPQRQPTAPQFLSYEQRRQQRRQAQQPEFNHHGNAYPRGRVGNPSYPFEAQSQYQQQHVYYPEQQQQMQAQLLAAAASAQIGSSQQYASAQQLHQMYGGYAGYGGMQTGMYDQRHRPPTPPKYRRGGSRPPQVPSQGYYSVNTAQSPQHLHNPYRGPHPRGRSGSDGSRGRIGNDSSVGTLPRSAGSTPPNTSPKLTPAAPPPTHVRTDSAGSISSMGSVGSKGMAIGDRSRDEKVAEAGERRRGDAVSEMHRGQDDRTSLGTPMPVATGPDLSPTLLPPAHATQESSGGSVGHARQDSVSSFLSGIWSWSPTLGGSKEMTVEEFHRRNQDFLQREGKRQQQKPSSAFPSPKQTHHRRSSKGGPPNSRGSHRPPLASIEDDYWDDSNLGRAEDVSRGRRSSRALSSSSNTSNTDPPPPPSNNAPGEVSASSSFLSSSDELEDDERTTLLPPSGISTGEGGSRRHRPHTAYSEEQHMQRPLSQSRHQECRSLRSSTSSSRNSSRRFGGGDSEPPERRSGTNRGSRKSARKKKSRRGRNSRRSGRTSRQIIGTEEFSDSEDSLQSSDSSDFDYRQWTKKRARMLEKERVKLIAQWKAEAKLEAEEARKEEEANRWHRKALRCFEGVLSGCFVRFFRFLASAETFIANLPLTIGAVALAVVTLGVVWYKFACENLDSCQPVHFHSAQCSFPEFPGCFDCDPSAHFYRIAVSFHYGCSIIAGVLALSFVLKVILATRVVLDEMSSPTTASPAGLICMTTVCVFAGRGWVGQVLVSVAAGMHLVLVTWFIYMALAYHILPDPSWFPNSVGIGLSAVKTWLYYPMAGHLLMAISLSLNFFFFPISLIRVTLSHKISAPVAWIQMSAPSISLYALTIMAQPSFIEEHPDVTKFQRVHRLIYLPCMSLLFALTIVGMVSSVQSLIVRWNEFKKKPFSPAHAAFCFPALAHANAIQAYRGAINSFSDGPEGSVWRIALYTYWVIVLVGGTVATLVITAKFLYRLPSWTHVDVADEEEPPAPYRTVLTQQDIITTGETLVQPFVSPAILQANETGALIRLPRGRDGVGRYVRTRRLPALGFEPTMNSREMQEEREVLLDWVVKNAPRRRKRTLSVPGIDFNYGYGDFGSSNQGVYGDDDARPFGHARGLSYQPEPKRDWKL